MPTFELDQSTKVATDIAWVLGAIGVAGVLCTLLSCVGIAKEVNVLRRGSRKLIEFDLERLHSSTVPLDFLNSCAAKDSHFGEWVLAVWGGWMANNLPSLTELHEISARRERRRTSARMATGITGLLVICGIAGTLFCIHPILRDFKVPSTQDAGVDSVARVAAATTMIKDLGEAFLPSMVALGMTVAVALSRGFYLNAASQLAWKLDRFAFDSLFGKFRPKMFPEMFAENLATIQSKLSLLISRMTDRDKDMEALLQKLTESTESLKAVAPDLVNASHLATGATQSFALNAKELHDGLNNLFGAESLVAQNLATIVQTGIDNRNMADELYKTSQELAGHTTAAMEKTAQAVNRATDAINGARTNLTDATHVAAKNLESAVGGAALIFTQAGQTASAHLAQTFSSGCSEAGETLLKAVRTGADDALGKFANAMNGASAELQTQVAPVQSAASDIGNANKSLQMEVRQALQKQLDEFRGSSESVLRGFDARIDATARKMVECQRAAADALEVADEVLRRAENIRPFTLGRAWQLIKRFFGAKS